MAIVRKRARSPPHSFNGPRNLRRSRLGAALVQRTRVDRSSETGEILKGRWNDGDEIEQDVVTLFPEVGNDAALRFRGWCMQVHRHQRTPNSQLKGLAPVNWYRRPGNVIEEGIFDAPGGVIARRALTASHPDDNARS
jgi:hypothetical protein